ncbi:hypothetical protein [Paracoccus mutanolyticus]|uniref:hypothetical protein n=1 Tax=Paracoccus mutanolyticus TaxID=1499308 RepID=UPI00167363D4|nr:hypothetical protein [Paracoccus mutanolyticus]
MKSAIATIKHVVQGIEAVAQLPILGSHEHPVHLVSRSRGCRFGRFVNGANVIPISWEQRWPALQSGDIDIV